jgi:hypothetical protein
MIFFGHERIENNGNITCPLLNPPDIGLTAPPSNLSLTVDSVHRLRPDRLPENLNEEHLQWTSLLHLDLRVITTTMRADLARLTFLRQISAGKSMKRPGSSRWSRRSEKPLPSSDIRSSCQILSMMRSIHQFPAGAYHLPLGDCLLAGFRAPTSVADAAHPWTENLRILLALSFIPFVVKQT